MSPQRIGELLQQALALHQAGKLDSAAGLYRQVRAAAPRNFDAAHLAGTLALQQGRLEEAASALGEARRLAPGSAVCAMRLGVARLALGQTALAEEDLRAALKLDPALPEGWFHLGRVLEASGWVDEAAAAFRRAGSVRPDFGEALDALGTLLFRAKGPEEAEPALRRAVEVQPGLARAWCNLGLCLVYRGRLGESLSCFDRAGALDPQMHLVEAGRGLALERLYRTEEAVAAYGRALAGDPKLHDARSSRLMALHYLPGPTREQIFREHQLFGQAVGGVPPNEPEPTGGPGGRLRIGFLSPNLRAHSVAYFLEPILARLDREDFEIFLYHDSPVTDEVSGRLRALASAWRPLAGLSDDGVAARVRADRLDVLIDLAGHTGHNRLPLFARRLAPVQATYLGYPDTTGLPAMDFRLVDALSDPPGDADRYSTERLVRFAPTAWCYAPPPEAPLPAPPSTTRGTGPVFGCFNNFAKVTDPMLRVWARLLAAVPGSTLAIKSLGLTNDVLQAGARKRFEAAGIDFARVRMLERTKRIEDHLAAYGGVDVALDTFPYHGTTTTCEALWMGVPVVTLAGDRHASRVGVSLLTAAGRAEWIAADEEAYVATAAALATDWPRLTVERTALRVALRRSPLLDQAGQAARFGAALRGLCAHRRARAAAPAEAPAA